MIVEFSHFSFRYASQEKPTLKNINLKIDKGEKILIIGPSGSGKSTLGQCLNGLIPHSFKGEFSGTLTINGQETQSFSMNHYSEQIGTVLQDTDHQFVGLSVGEDIAFALENQMVANLDMYPIVKATARMVELEQLLDVSPHELSGGQKQRVSLAGVLVDDVDILLFDEPLAALDPKTSKKTIEIIDQLHLDSGKTIIIIEHRLEDVLHRKVDRIILMDKGEIVSDSTPDELLASDLLLEHGIREPLYLSALKSAGCKIDASIKLSQLSQIDIQSFKPQLLRWFQQNQQNDHKTYSDVLLKVRNLSFSYDDGKKVLDDVCFDLYKGEFLSILGKNGSGKSTLTKLLMGVLEQDSGKIWLNDQDLCSKNIFERSQKIGVVMQNPNHMISHHMIYDEIAFGLINRGLNEQQIEQKIVKLLNFCGLSKFRYWPIEALSYGQKKRVSIAAILALEPDLLILDEPTAGQDQRNYTSMLNFIKKLHKELGITVIIISHDMHLVLEHTTRSLVFCEGKLIADAPMCNIFSDPALLDSANLATTSLYDMAIDIGLPANCFIQNYIEKNNPMLIKENTALSSEEIFS